MLAFMSWRWRSFLDTQPEVVGAGLGAAELEADPEADPEALRCRVLWRWVAAGRLLYPRLGYGAPAWR